MWTPVCAEPTEILLGFRVVLAAADPSGDFLVEGLDADFELERGGREFLDEDTERFGKAVGNHLEMEEQPWLITVEEKLENGGAGFQIEVECAVNEFELAAAAVEKALHGGEKSVERKLADRFVEGGETELAFVGTTSRGFDVNDAMREVVVGVEIVRQRERGEVGKRRAGRRSGRKSKGMSGSKRRRGR